MLAGVCDMVKDVDIDTSPPQCYFCGCSPPKKSWTSVKSGSSGLSKERVSKSNGDIEMEYVCSDCKQGAIERSKDYGGN
jgi:hypothetical protein